MIFGHIVGKNPYRSIVSAKISWRHCDIVFDFIVIKFFLLLYLDSALLHIK